MKSILIFRLLTEYHSFLYWNVNRIRYIIIMVFRLLTEYHSFLSDVKNGINKAKEMFSVSLRSIIHSYLKIFLI